MTLVLTLTLTAHLSPFTLTLTRFAPAMHQLGRSYEDGEGRLASLTLTLTLTRTLTRTLTLALAL